MAKHEIIIPKMGESIIEATITKWLVKEGDVIAEEDPIVELATDKVDSEIPSPIDGTIEKILFKEGEVVPVGEVIAIVALEGDDAGDEAQKEVQKVEIPEPKAAEEPEPQKPVAEAPVEDDRFYSPLVRKIAKEENIDGNELSSIKGTGKDGRVTKNDILMHLETRDQQKPQVSDAPAPKAPVSPKPSTPAPEFKDGDEIVQMDRMRKLIADHMVASVQTSPHVTSFIEVDMEPIVQWRKKNKEAFMAREKQKLTFTPIFIEAAARALRDFPGVNASVDGDKIILRKDVNVGMAAALPNGNLIVPVIKQADRMNLAGLAASVNDLAQRSRENKLQPDEISGGTFTITNLGTFGSTTGTPIINQPQVAILGIGVIEKKPVVVETELGDTIAIRHRCVLSLSYDHRVVDGALGGMFLQRVAQYLENFDTQRTA
jgi:2-oxoglutarate dehydrogenase E2 component (dihydrolipoamide succinyltransferase)